MLRIICAMGAAEKFKRIIVKSLHPQRQPRNAGMAQFLQMHLRGADRIGLERYFRVTRQTP